MFGYVRPPLQVLPEEEGARFRRIYCGLCHTLRRRYGQAARLILNYDFTYLAILLSPGEEGGDAWRRCLPHPVHGRNYLESGEALDLAADESVILAYWQLQDGAADHSWLRGLKYRSASAILSQAYRTAAARRPAFDGAVREKLGQLAELEREECGSIDRTADCFASLLASAAAEVEDPVRQRILEQVLYHLGRWIYLVDAADDLRRDHESGNYNPVALRYGLRDGLWTPEARQEFASTLDHSIHMMATAFELWDFGVWTALLEATIYTGFFQVGKAVLDGTFRAAGRGDRDRNPGEQQPAPPDSPEN